MLRPLLLCGGLALFLKGILLTRREILTKSSFGMRGDEYSAIHAAYDSLRAATKPKKVFLFIIDALRRDFVTEDNFPGMFALLSSNASQCLLTRLRADPPTVTSQRIKAMTVGTFPTFVDIGSNFHSKALLEDNLVAQLREAGRRSVVLGDDTWEALFPKAFSVSVPLDSFNTRDLHSVDAGIEQRLWEHLRCEDDHCWDFFVAHFLGVDHIGHTHSARHPLMRAKLRWMDALLMRVVHALPADTVLLVLGDHGMTDEGNHGGATEAEVESALLVYSTERLFASDSRPLEGLARVVSQIDLVPTLSVLMGLPIPFSSVGALVSSLFSPHAGVPPRALAVYLAVNAVQVARYLKQYFGIAHPHCSHAEDASMSCLLHRVERLLSLHNSLLSHYAAMDRLCASRQLCDGPDALDTDATLQLQAEYAGFLASVAARGRTHWTSFNLWLVAAGAALLVALLLLIGGDACALLMTDPAAAPPLTGLALLLVCCLQVIGPLSNSLVQEEPRLLLFAVQSCLGLRAMLLLRAKHKADGASVAALLLGVCALRAGWAVRMSVLEAGMKFDLFSTAPFRLLLLAPPALLQRVPGESPLVRPLLACCSVLALLHFSVALGRETMSAHTTRALSLLLPRLALALCQVSLVLLCRRARDPASLLLRLCAALSAVACCVALVTGVTAMLLLLLVGGAAFAYAKSLQRVSAERGASNWLLFEWSAFCCCLARLSFFLTCHSFDFGTLHVCTPLRYPLCLTTPS